MYLKSVSISVFDAKYGDLLVTGSWGNGVFHPFPNSRLVVNHLLHAMMDKLHCAET